MKFKIDENLPLDAAAVLAAAGHDTESVYSEGLEGAPDRRLIAVCKREQRILITLDYDFSNILIYPPEKHEGIIVLRVEQQNKENVINLIKKLLPILSKEMILGHLWIVEENKIRVRG